MRLISSITAAITIGISLIAATPAKAETTYLVISTWTQVVGEKLGTYRYAAPNLTVISMDSTKQCEASSEQIIEDLYKPVLGMDGQWTCVAGK